MLPENWAAAIAAAEGVLTEDIAARAAGLEAGIRRMTETGAEIFPPIGSIFRAYELTPPENVKVVLLGQDPYHGPGQAMGLSFSVPSGTALPPSLKNIFRELRDDIGCEAPPSGDLTAWAQRGVLLLNTALTVRAHEPASHARYGWDAVTRGTLLACMRMPRPVVFILWGAHAQKAAQTAAEHPAAGDREALARDKLFLCSAHPSPLSARKGFFGSRPFSRANAFLQSRGAEPVDWDLSGGSSV